ncbi:benzoate 4-monooxygenase cytochrome P450 [Cordyceps fumosorosea ARSEF 2679]|uniref:Benzoate 4-monooxygenase cytochrome P450 n=1 Tax=Cordyceps fumosorosea (strain ARSEF 2679) TaxID=1081104 RepID=A0A168BQ92_CORFA|nr:benzoate 4-monooxygenase cytochrome P450 [Cordyceps fumosorosea ARSEF 2679]OAA70411.1 benzoate 4-monooxygenase cytochrome P450 [Cordyceps fumosorosea ARSEF 2679]
MAWLAASLAALALAYITSQLYSYQRLRHIKGPALASWTNFWLVYAQLTGRIHTILHELVSKHGPIVRIAPDWVVCGDPTEIRRIWGARSRWTRAWWYRGMRIDPYQDSSFSTRDDALHTAIRSKLVPGYSGKEVDNLHELVQDQVQSLVRLLDKHVSDGGASGSRVVDMAQKIQYFALDTISSLAFDAPFGFMESDEDRFRYIETTGNTVYILVATALIPGVIRLIQSPYLQWAAPKIKDMAGIGDVIKTAERVVAERYGADPLVKRDMLGSFVKHGFSQKDAETEALIQIIAGSETTATAIQATILHVITSPRVYARLQAEIDAAEAEGRVSRPVTNAEAQSLEYLQAVILEGLRVFPPAAALYPKVCDADEVVCGVPVPAGTNVAWSPWSIMRDRDVFGEDADLFRPERWLGASRTKTMEQTVMMAFASGSRWECLGKNIAQLELNLVFVELFRRFEFTLVNPAMPWKSFNAGMFSQTDLNISVTRRTAA